MTSLNEIKKNFSASSSVVALGNFDGVHEGHRAIFKRMLEIAKIENLKPIVFVLFPHPKEFFTGSSPALLSTLENRLELVRECGIQEVHHLAFDQALSIVPAQELIKVFQHDFQMRHLVIGPTTHMGKNRDGTPNQIQEWASIMNYGLTIVPQLEIKGCKVSSSLIREYILRGDVRLSADMLGRFYSSSGIVETGAGKGRTIGYPTANIAKIQTIVPARGVYAGYAYVRNQKYKAAINIGIRPTLASDKKLVVEAHLIDFNDKIVGQSLKIEWVERLREEVKFESVDQLKLQIDLDVRKAKDIL
ncbi:MAG: riboflavin biosynthesis protein RibF [Bdellovibrionota bacterium]